MKKKKKGEIDKDVSEYDSKSMEITNSVGIHQNMVDSNINLSNKLTDEFFLWRAFHEYAQTIDEFPVVMTKSQMKKSGEIVKSKIT